MGWVGNENQAQEALDWVIFGITECLEKAETVSLWDLARSRWISDLPAREGTQ